MRKSFGFLFCAILLFGCSSLKPTTAKPAKTISPATTPVITPDFRTVGKVARVNMDGRFAVITFSPGQLPKANDLLDVYRNGLKVAEVKVDGRWQSDNNTVADIVAGEVQAGDEVRQN
jgi:hypothetical protein